MIEQDRLFRVQTFVKSKPRPAASAIRMKVIYLLRLSLSAVFFWFGMLKITGVSPIVGLLRESLPVLATTPYLELLGLAEVVIATGLVFDRLASQAATLMMLHLLCTLSIVLISPALVFAPAFPVFTMEGEFLAKNVVFIMAGLVIISSRNRPKSLLG